MINWKVCCKKKENELRELEKERGELEYKQADAKRTAKEAETRGETGVKALQEELTDLQNHLDDEINARTKLSETCTLLSKALNAAKMKIRQLQKMLDKKEQELAQQRNSSGAGTGTPTGGQKRGGGPAARTPASTGTAAAAVSSDDEDGEDPDAIMNA